MADGPGEQTWTEVTWKEMAQRNGRVAHALMEEHNICAGQDDSRQPVRRDGAPAVRSAAVRAGSENQVKNTPAELPAEIGDTCVTRWTLELLLLLC